MRTTPTKEEPEQVEPHWPFRTVGEQVKLSEMIWLCNDEAERIEGMESARAAAGEQRNVQRVRQAEVFRAVARFLLMLEPFMDAIRELMRRRKRS